MYWSFAVHWLGYGLSLNFRSSNSVCSLPLWGWEWITSGQIDISPLLLRIHFHSPCQFVLGTLICNDGWGDAWKSRASQTTHQDSLIGVFAVSSSRRVAVMVPKSDSQNQKSDVHVHKRLPKMCLIYSLGYQTRVLSDSGYALRAKVGVFCLCKKKMNTLKFIQCILGHIAAGRL